MTPPRSGCCRYEREEARRNASPQRRERHVGRHADDRDLDRVLPRPDREPLSDRVAPVEERADHRLVDHDHPRRARGVARRERASHPDRQADGLEERRIDHLHERRGLAGRAEAEYSRSIVPSKPGTAISVTDTLPAMRPMSDSVADDTPGSARRSSSSREYRSRSRSPSYPDRVGSMSKTSRFDGSKPSDTRSRLTTVRSSRPAPTLSSTASAICVTSRPAASRELAVAAQGPERAVLQRTGDVGPRAAQRRRETEEDARTPPRARE